MKKEIEDMAMKTFSLADLPSGKRARLEEQIMEHALAHWRKKLRTRAQNGFQSMILKRSGP